MCDWGVYACMVGDCMRVYLMRDCMRACWYADVHILLQLHTI